MDPGVRPIGIGDVSRRILAKVILSTVGNDIQYFADLCRGGCW